MAKKEWLTSWQNQTHNSGNQARHLENARTARSTFGRGGNRTTGNGRPIWIRECMEALLKVQDAECPRCEVEAKLRLRPFSDQALSALVVWGEISERVVGQPICESCYEELRDILIERQEEITNPRPPERYEEKRVTATATAKRATPAKTTTKTAAKAAAKPAAKSTTKTASKSTKKPAKKSVKRAS